MLIQIEKDTATKIVKEVTEDEAARLATMFPVSIVAEDGSTTSYGVVESEIASAPPEDDAFVEVGATRFSDGKKQTKKSLAAAIEAWKAAHPE